MVAVVRDGGSCLFANAAFENVLGLPRRSVLRGSLFDWFIDASTMRDTVAAVIRNDFSTSRWRPCCAGRCRPMATRCRCT